MYLEGILYAWRKVPHVKEEGSYAYSLRVGRKLFLLIDVSSRYSSRVA
jgi:hypothetical protein